MGTIRYHQNGPRECDGYRHLPALRRIFPSSLCGMFENSHQSKADACGLACCGLWLWDRNQFLFDQKKPATWRQRPLVIVAVLFAGASASLWTFGVVGNTTTISVICLGISALIMAYSFCKFQRARYIFRRRLAINNYVREHSELQGRKPTIEVELKYLDEHNRQLAVHRCCTFAPLDTSVSIGDSEDAKIEPPKDCCHKLWKLIACLCCEYFCFCWCECCGMCAIAQEHRYLRETIPSSSDAWWCDYITFEPWKDYYPKILNLRISKELRFLPHVRALSRLSSWLIKALGFIAFLTILAVTLPSSRFSDWEMLILFGTLLQPLLILYFVYWYWNRLNISTDAIIKYFASGFFVCGSITLLYQLVVSVVIYTASLSVFGLGFLVFIPEESKDSKSIDEDPRSELPVSYLIALSLAVALVESFLLAALIEELGKYLCFWMIEHPDLDLEHYERRDGSHGDEESLEQPAGTGRMQHSASLVSRGTAITIAMVTTALGFSCAETLFFIFVDVPHQGIESKLLTMILRLTIPVHPLAAALQSIGVCRRDLEKTRGNHIILPSWLMHGAFDFVLIGYACVIHALEIANPSIESVPPATNLMAEMKDLCIPLLTALIPVVVGLLYYIKEARSQRKRLSDLDVDNVEDASLNATST